MRYALLICTDENDVSTRRDDELIAEYDAFSQEMDRRGVLRGGERLRPTSSATLVQVRHGKVLTSDGPFADTKEQMGGFYLVECNDLDEAIEVAARIPAAGHGTIEVRPIWEKNVARFAFEGQM